MQEKINELKKRREKIESISKEKIESQHSKGKLTARERILQLLDKDTFCEIDAFVEHRCSDFGMEKMKIAGEGVITGYGKINGRQVCIYAQDFTVIGGSLGQMHAAKICKAQDMAIKLGCPCIGINDSGGARIQEGIDALRGYGDIFYRNVQASGVIPQICVIMGPCAGGAVYSPALMDFILMTDKTSNMFITGPQVVKAVTGEQVNSEELGGALVHSQKSGVASLMFKDERETLEGVKKLLSYIPQNNLEDTPFEETGDSPNRNDSKLSNILPDQPNKPYDIKDIIKSVVDNGEFFELQPLFAKNIVICFARFDGKSVGIIANQPNVMAGVLDINAADKAARFIRFCDSFNIPIITFVDTAGYLPGVESEISGIEKDQIDSEVKVIRNDQITPEEILELAPEALVISPGPGKPSDAGICIEAIQKLKGKIPMLGVCLGHQAMAEAFGATVGHAGQLMHGKTSKLKDVKTDSVLFQNLTLPIQVARYHSLAVKEETLPEELIVTARSEDNEIMAMEHKEYPIFGLQFHPESVMTPQGLQMIENFINYAKALKEN